MQNCRRFLGLASGAPAPISRSFKNRRKDLGSTTPLSSLAARMHGSLPIGRTWHQLSCNDDAGISCRPPGGDSPPGQSPPRRQCARFRFCPAGREHPDQRRGPAGQDPARVFIAGLGGGWQQTSRICWTVGSMLWWMRDSNPACERTCLERPFRYEEVPRSVAGHPRRHRTDRGSRRRKAKRRSKPVNSFRCGWCSIS